MSDADPMLVMTKVARKAPMRVPLFTVLVELRQVIAGLAALVVVAPLIAAFYAITGSAQIIGVGVALALMAGGAAAVMRPGGESLPKYLLRTVIKRTGRTEYRGRKVKVYVGLCPLPQELMMFDQEIKFLQHAVPINPESVGPRGNLLPVGETRKQSADLLDWPASD